jgi:hypothetical protein
MFMMKKSSNTFQREESEEKYVPPAKRVQTLSALDNGQPKEHIGT